MLSVLWEKVNYRWGQGAFVPVPGPICLTSPAIQMPHRADISFSIMRTLELVFELHVLLKDSHIPGVCVRAGVWIYLFLLFLNVLSKIFMQNLFIWRSLPATIWISQPSGLSPWRRKWRPSLKITEKEERSLSGGARRWTTLPRLSEISSPQVIT